MTRKSIGHVTGQVFGALRETIFFLRGNPQYASFCCAFFLAQIGFCIQLAAMAWLVLSLTGSAHSLGVLALIQTVPVFLLTLHSGALADRAPQKRILLAGMLCVMVTAAWFAPLVVSGRVNIWQIYVFALAHAILNVISLPARQAFAASLAGEKYVAITAPLNSITYNVALIAGSVVAGIIASMIGNGWNFVIRVLFAIPFIIVVLMLPHEAISSSSQPKSVRKAVHFLWDTPSIRRILIFVILVNTLAMNLATLVPIFAKLSLRLEAGQYGLLMSTMGIGALMAGLWSLRPGDATIRTDRIMWSAAVLGTGYFMLAWADSFASACFLIMIVSFATVSILINTSSIFISSVPQHLRGRVAGMNALIAIGSNGPGGWLTATSIEIIGMRASLLVISTSVFASILLCWRWPNILQKPVRYMRQQFSGRSHENPHQTTFSECLSSPPRYDYTIPPPNFASCRHHWSESSWHKSLANLVDSTDVRCQSPYGLDVPMMKALAHFGSCTTNPIDPHTLARFTTLSTQEVSTDPAQMLKDLFGIDQCVLAWSGTDAEYTVSLAMGHRSFVSIMMDPMEVGSGTMLAAQGLPHVQGCCLSDALPIEVTLCTVAMRQANGDPRAEGDIDDDVSKIVGRHCHRPILLRMVACSKTGLFAPSENACRTIAQAHQNVRVVVDASQGRCSRSDVLRWLSYNWAVIITGSKFFGAPPFCGATLFPASGWMSVSGTSSVTQGLLARWRLALPYFEQHFSQTPASAIHVQSNTRNRALWGNHVQDAFISRLRRVRRDGHYAHREPGIVAFDIGLSFEASTKLHRSLILNGFFLGQPVRAGERALLRLAWGVRTDVHTVVTQLEQLANIINKHLSDA